MPARPVARGGVVRGTAEHLGGTRVRYRWPCGHTQVVDHSLGSPPRRIGAFALAFLVRYWAGTGGVNLKPCTRGRCGGGAT